MMRQYRRDIPITGGLQQATSDLAGDGFLTLQNVSRYRTDAIRRRPGLAERIDTAGIVMSGLRINGQDRIVQLLDTGAIVAHQTSYGAVVSTVVASSLVTSSTYGVFAHADNQLIFANGTDSVRYINSVGSTGTVGLGAPSGSMPTAYSTNTSATSVISAGDHLMRYRYMAQAAGFWSDPSTTRLINVSAEAAVGFLVGTTANTTIVAPTDSRVDRIIIEATKANGTVFYPVAESSTITTGTVIRVNTTDQEFEAKAYSYSYPEAAGEDVGNSSPPTLDYIAEHRGRLFGTYGRYLYWSQYGRPYSWNSAEQARSLFQSSDDIPTGLISVSTDLYCFGRNTVIRFAYTDYPDEGVLNQLPTRVGLWHQRLLVKAEGRIYGWGPSGIWTMSVMMPKIISEAIRPTLLDEVDYDYVEQFHAVHDPEDRVILFFYVPSGETTCTGCMVYDYINSEWRTNDYDRSIQCSYMLNKLDGQARAFVADDASHTYHMESGLLDGVQSGGNANVTAAASTASTTLTVNENVPTAQTVVGSYLYRVSDGTTRRITANTINSITISSTFSTSTITSGEEFFIGSIDVIAEPKWISAPDPFDKIRLKQACLRQVPDSSATGQWNIYYYKDFDTTATSKTILSTDYAPDGESVVDGDDKLQADTDQTYVNLRYFDSGWFRVFKLKLQQRDPDCDPTLTGISFRFEVTDGGAE